MSARLFKLFFLFYDKMWIGIALAAFYSRWGFGQVGEPPRLSITVGPFQNGHLIVCGRHVHHWMVYPFVAIVAWQLRWYNVVSFSCTMVAHGLSYEDRFEI